MESVFYSPAIHNPEFGAFAIKFLNFHNFHRIRNIYNKNFLLKSNYSSWRNCSVENIILRLLNKIEMVGDFALPCHLKQVALLHIALVVINWQFWLVDVDCLIGDESFR